MQNRSRGREDRVSIFDFWETGQSGTEINLTSLTHWPLPLSYASLYDTARRSTLLDLCSRPRSPRSLHVARLYSHRTV